MKRARCCCLPLLGSSLSLSMLLFSRYLNALIDPTGSAIDPHVTSPSGVRCKRTNVSRLVVKLCSLYKCHLDRRTPYACSPTLDGSVLIVAVREYIVASGSVSAPPSLLGVGPSQYSVVA